MSEEPDLVEMMSSACIADGHFEDEPVQRPRHPLVDVAPELWGQSPRRVAASTVDGVAYVPLGYDLKVEWISGCRTLTATPRRG